LKALKRICLIVFGSFMVLLPAAATASTERQICLLIRLPGSGEEWTETIEFKPNGIAITLRKMPKDHRAHFQATHKSAPTEFVALWDWAEKHGVVQQTP